MAVDFTLEVKRMLPVVADSWDKLRGCDVERLLSQFDYEQQCAAGKVVCRFRPDLAHEVREALADMEADVMG